MSGDAEPPLLRVCVVRAGSSVVVRLDGELDVATAPYLDDALASVINDEQLPERLLVDADRLEFADVAGLGALIRARDALPPTTQMQLRNAPRQVVRVLRLLELGELLGLDC